MKAAILFALASSAAAAAINCQIPPQYAFATGTGCGGPMAGYRIFGVCTTGVSTTTVPTALAPTSVLLDSTNLAAFTSIPTGLPGCVIPPSGLTWNGVALTDTTTAGLTAATNCLAATAGALDKDKDALRGAYIECDRGADYYPTQGFEGTVLCAKGAATLASIFTASGTGDDYWVDSNTIFAQPSAPPALGIDTTTTFTQANSLICSQACTLPSYICNNGVFASNILVTGTGFNLARCLLLPGQTLTPNAFSFQCATGGPLAPIFSVTCTAANAGGLATVSPAYTNQCGTAYGAQTTPLFFRTPGHLARFLSIVQPAGAITPGFTSVTSTVSTAYAAKSFVLQRLWNNNPSQDFRDGAVYTIDVVGCENVPPASQTQCVQHTLNWWRCKHNVDFQGAICYANFVPIACPTHELGFRCPSGSKKGLLGLLGLLGLIPLLLLCCCLFFLCCIRRRKTEADVHFATFDPHAAPVVATALPCATAVPTFGPMGTPYAGGGVPVF